MSLHRHRSVFRGHEMCGFTLSEVLVVLVVISVLAAILLPALAAAREKARQAVCVSDLRQLGLAAFQYAQDNNDRLPYGADVCDQDTGGWNNTVFHRRVRQMKPLPVVMLPYTTTEALWRCPSDTGQDSCGLSDRSLDPAYRDFSARGMSYGYHTEIPLRGLALSGLTLYDAAPPYTARGPSEIMLLFDATGTWHQPGPFSPRRYDVLLADGHARSLEQDQVTRMWNQTFTPPAPQ